MQIKKETWYVNITLWDADQLTVKAFIHAGC